MTTAEARSIYNGPIRRSFAAADNRTRELAQVVSDLADEVAELQETLATNAQRLMGASAVLTYDVTIPPSSFGFVTNAVSVQTVAGHYYRVAMRLRALTTSPAQGIGVGYTDNSVISGDGWTWIGGSYQGLTHEWLFFGDGGHHTYQGVLRAGSSPLTSSGGDGHFYCEHLGLVIPG